MLLSKPVLGFEFYCSRCNSYLAAGKKNTKIFQCCNYCAVKTVEAMKVRPADKADKAKASAKALAHKVRMDDMRYKKEIDAINKGWSYE